MLLRQSAYSNITGTSSQVTPGFPHSQIRLRVASPKVREHGRTTPVAYELASDTYHGLGVVTRYAFTILPLRHSLRQAISVVQEGCVKRGSAPSLPGMKIHAAIQFSLSWMIAFLVWNVDKC